MNFDSAFENCPSFRRVLKEMERTMGVVRHTIHWSGQKLEWTEKPSIDPNPEMDRHDPSRDVVRNTELIDIALGFRPHCLITMDNIVERGMETAETTKPCCSGYLK